VTLTSVMLVDGSRQMILYPRQDQGVYLQTVDAPSPGTREVTEDRTDDDGARDTTTLFGARACTVELLVTQGARAVEDELSRYLHPRSRPYLRVEDDGWTQARWLALRVDQFSAPLSSDLAPDMRKIQVQWKCPDGIWEAADLTMEPVPADVQGDPVGVAFPVTFPFSFAATMATGSTIVTSLGAVPSHFTAQLYGPCTAPKLVNDTTGETIAFTESLTLAAGEYVEIDTRERTAFLLSDSSLSRLNYVDFTTTSWWRLEPGDNAIRYTPRDADAGATAIITYRPAWL
jgi:hypothetical protein